MQLGAVTYNVLKDMDLDTVIKTLETTGFQSVELRTGDKHGVEPSIPEAERARVKSGFDAGKVKLLSTPFQKFANVTNKRLLTRAALIRATTVRECFREI